MKVLLKRVGECPRFIDIPNEYESFKELLDGEPTAAPAYINHVVVVSDKDFKKKQLNYKNESKNLNGSFDVTGDAIFVTYKHIIFESITEDDADRVVEHYFPEYAEEYRLRGKRGL